MSKKLAQQAKGKTKQMWKIFYDDENHDENDSPSTSDAKRTVSSIKRTIKKGVNKALPGKQSIHHGVMYQGLMDNYTDSEEEAETAQADGRQRPGSSEEVSDLHLNRETVLYEMRQKPETKSNGVQHYKKDYNPSDWESIEVSENSPSAARRLLQPIPKSGARYVIRSEDDLELAIAVTKKPLYCGCCHCECNCEHGLQKYSRNYAVIILGAVTVTAIYVAIVICIVYGFG